MDVPTSVSSYTDKLIALYQVNTYITYPKDNKTPEKAVLVLTDVFGIFSNSQLLADEFANSGYLAVIPDLFRGDQLRPSDTDAGKVDVMAWLQNHQIAQVEPVVESTIKYVHETLGVKKIGAVGYCFGGKVCFFHPIGRYMRYLLYNTGYVYTDILSVSLVCLPFPEARPDRRRLLGASIFRDPRGTWRHCRSLFNRCLWLALPSLSSSKCPGIMCHVNNMLAVTETDSIFTTQLRHESEDILIKAGQPWQINVFSGVSHGFAIRADLSDKTQKFAKEQAFYQAVAWFNQYL